MLLHRFTHLQIAICRRPWLIYTWLVFIFWTCGLALVAPSLEAQFFSDDLHLIRTYSADELRGVWWGAWDPDGIETVGFRPLTTWFNHVRAGLLGESVAAHRITLLGLFAVYLALMAAVARLTLGANHLIGLLAGLLTLWHVDSVYHYFWISDGVHLIVGLSIAGAVLLLLKFLSTRQARWLWFSSALVGLAIMTREDGLIAYPLLTFFGGVYLVQFQRWRQVAVRPLLIYAITLICVGSAIWGWRTLVVRDAVLVSADLHSFLWSIVQVVQNFGDVSNLVGAWAIYELIVRAWQVAIILLGVVVVFVLPRSSKLRVLTWLTAMLLATLPGLTAPRTNLLLMPVTLWSLAVATTLTSFGGRSRQRAVVAALIAGVTLGVSGWSSRTLQAEARPSNVEWICGQPAWVYGEYSSATIPLLRRAQIQAQLARHGIHSMSDVGERVREIIQQAAAADRHTPDDRGTPFIPRLSFIVYPGWQDWSCAVQTLR